MSRFKKWWNQVNRLQNIATFVSPISGAIYAAAVAILIAVIFRLTGTQILITFFVDWVALVLVTLIDFKFFTALYPDSKLYLRGINDAEISKLNADQRAALLQSFLLFPARRARYAYLFSFFKIIPAAVMVAFVYHGGHSPWARLATLYLSALVYFCYFYGVIFLESHVYLSERIEELHRKHDFSEAFQKVEVPYSKRALQVQESMVLGFIVLFMLGLQLKIILDKEWSDVAGLSLEVIVVGVVSFGLLARILYLERNYFLGGLEKILHQLNASSYQQFQPVLPINTFPLLARFEQSYNDLSLRLRSSEQELSALVVKEADKSRYKALGEMSALIAHDLSAPLHGSQFWVQELIERPGHPRQDEYLARIHANNARAIELLQSLRARIRNDGADGTIAIFGESHRSVLKLLAMQFLGEDFKKIRIDLDPCLDQLTCRIPSSDLVHVLDNLYRNAVAAMLSAHTPEPLLRVRLLGSDDDQVNVVIEDSGPGLGANRFEEMTAYNFVQSSQPGVSRVGLGLRLTRRLVELNEGKMAVCPTPLPGIGTCFVLQLRSAQMVAQGLKVQERQEAHVDAR